MRQIEQINKVSLIESFKYFFVKISLRDANDAPPQLDGGLNGTAGGATIISFLHGTRA